MSDSMTAAEFLATAAKPSKYGNVKTTIDGVVFASKREANRYAELKLLLDAGEIHTLELQPDLVIEVNGVTVCTYKADFGYMTGDGRIIYEDAKGVRTAVYRLKRKLVKACYGIDIQEV